MGLAIRKTKKSAWEMELCKPKARKAAEYVSAEEESKCLAAEAAGEVGISDEGASSGYVV